MGVVCFCRICCWWWLDGIGTIHPFLLLLLLLQLLQLFANLLCCCCCCCCFILCVIDGIAILHLRVTIQQDAAVLFCYVLFCFLFIVWVFVPVCFKKKESRPVSFETPDTWLWMRHWYSLEAPGTMETRRRNVIIIYPNHHLSVVLC